MLPRLAVGLPERFPKPPKRLSSAALASPLITLLFKKHYHRLPTMQILRYFGSADERIRPLGGVGLTVAPPAGGCGSKAKGLLLQLAATVAGLLMDPEFPAILRHVFTCSDSSCCMRNDFAPAAATHSSLCG